MEPTDATDRAAPGVLGVLAEPPGPCCTARSPYASSAAIWPGAPSCGQWGGIAGEIAIMLFQAASATAVARARRPRGQPGDAVAPTTTAAVGTVREQPEVGTLPSDRQRQAPLAGRAELLRR